ncbi:MAG: type II secretion system F family protein [Desulfovibrionaceae bacterium]|nr:type II secretion system F family protein [Desulfovibrionaceae bacterium]MBF0512888.1 type II secretion system F family protein [Desulfovibrionaceae bacterium]
MDNRDVWLALVAVILAVAVAAFGINAWLAERERRERVKARLSGNAAADTGHGDAWEGLRLWLVSLAGRVGDSFQPKKTAELSKLRTRLIHAGLRQHNAPAVFWGVKMGMLAVGAAAAVLLNVTVLGAAKRQIVLLVYLFVPAFFLFAPGFWLDKKIEARKKAIQNGLPDALDLLVVCVEAGMGMDQAIHRVSLEMRTTCPVLSEELRTLTLELRAGKSRREGLKNLAGRIGLDDVNSLVALLIQADLFGTSVAATLRIYADAMRTKRFQKAEEIAAKLPVKMLLPLIFFILPPLFIVIMGPGVLRLMHVLSNINK